METPEIWKPVQGFPDYDVSNLGRVRTWRVRRGLRKWEGHKPVKDVSRMTRLQEPRILSGTITPLGYVAFILRDPESGKPVRKCVHRLVAQVFLPNPLSLSDVAHGDGNPGNNRADNLRWSTHRDNQMDMRRHGTMQDGEKCIAAKLTAEQVRYIRAMCPKGRSGRQVAAAKEFGVSKTVICNIVNRKIWKHLD